MTLPFPGKRLFAAATLLASTTMLSGCLFQPGTFDATMHITTDRQFAFAYRGEIVMAGMNELAEMAANTESAKPCVDEMDSKERPCTDAELAERASDEAMGRQIMQGMVGGVDLSNPENVAEMTAMLERQAGWNSVEFVGDGVFDVDFSITSTLGHDFDFPTFEDMPISNGFVQARLRDDGRAHISAPGFSPAGGNPMAAVFMGMFGAFAEGAAEGEGPPPGMDMRQPEGTFRLITDATILTNNTDEGPQPDPRGQMLVWEIDGRTTAPPAALLQFAN